MSLRLSCAVALVVLAGCGGSDTSTPVAESQSPTDGVMVDPGTESVSQSADVPEDPDPSAAATFESLSTSIQQAVQNQNLVTKKNRKLKRLKALYPHIRAKIFYKKDLRDLVHKHEVTKVAWGGPSY